MGRIEQLAEISVARGCGFAGLAILTFMELWMMLERRERPAAAVPQCMICTVLRGCYLRFALQGASLAAVLLGLSLILAFAPQSAP